MISIRGRSIRFAAAAVLLLLAPLFEYLYMLVGAGLLAFIVHRPAFAWRERLPVPRVRRRSRKKSEPARPPSPWRWHACLGGLTLD